MKKIGIKLADGTFYPILDEGEVKTKQLDLTTAHDKQKTVQVELYRSETGTMEDAEYVDTLVVKHLKAHPIEETELHLSVGLDENNELTAKVIDDETGKESEFSCQLVSKTLSETESEPDVVDNDFDFGDSGDIENATISEDFQPEETVNVADSDDFSDTSDFSDINAFDLDVPDADAETDVSDKDKIENTDTLDEPFSFDSIDTDIDVPTEGSDFEDFTIDAASSKEPTLKDPDITEKSLSDDDFGFDSFDSLNLDEEPAADSEEKVEFAEEKLVDEVDSEPTANEFAEIETNEFEINETEKDEIKEEPVFEEKTEENLEESTDSVAKENVLEESDFELPSFDDLESTDLDSSFDDFESKETVADSSAETEGLGSFFDDIKNEDFSTDGLDDDIDFGDMENDFDGDDIAPKEPSYHDKATPGSSMDFSNLYDEETLNAETEEETVRRKTRGPVIICIICAIICILATLLVLFVVPSKYNLLGKRSSSSEKIVEKVVSEPTEAELAAEKARAEAAEKKALEEKLAREKAEAERKEVEEKAAAERLAAEKAIAEAERKAKEAAELIPVPPQPKKPSTEIYKIKWGDTLWDISESYYKTPWKYKKIAKDNNIKNPDVIISGTKIEIKNE